MVLGIAGMKRRLGIHGNVVAHTTPPLSTRSPSADGAHLGRPAVMEIISLKLHRREPQMAIEAEDGTIADRRIVADPNDAPMRSSRPPSA